MKLQSKELSSETIEVECTKCNQQFMEYELEVQEENNSQEKETNYIIVVDSNVKMSMVLEIILLNDTGLQ